MDSYRITKEDLEKLLPDVEQRQRFWERLVEAKKEEGCAAEGCAQPSECATPTTCDSTETCATTTTCDSTETCATSTSAMPRKAKRKHDFEAPSNPRKKRDSPVDYTSASATCEDDKSKAIKLMDDVKEKLTEKDNSLVNFLRESIERLDPDEKVVVGVFGKTGAGKSSLINAVIGKDNLLPTGSVEACTSVIIKVEGNTEHDYRGKVEFISEQDFNNELDFLKLYFGEEAEEEREDCDEDYECKLTALFEDEWKKKTLESLKKESTYKDIIKTLKKKTVTFSEYDKQKFCEELKKYTKEESENDQSDDNVSSTKKTKIWYWPVVEKVTIKVPNNELLRHVTLVDLPGNGDYNKTRNEMWKKMLSRCGIVWVVTEVTRAASEVEAWELFESACKHLGHGGECRKIYFICTKLDHMMEKSEDNTELKQSIKNKVKKKIMNNKEFKKHFSDDCFQVFIVSAKAYFNSGSLLAPEETEIPELQEVIRKLNSQQERTSRYVSAAYGILSLMKGARTQNDLEKEKLREILSTNSKNSLMRIESFISDWFLDFERSLTKGVADAKESCEQRMKKIINIKHHNTLKSVVEKNGIHKPGKGKEINLNTTLSSFLTDCIDHLFREVFPNDQKPDSFYSIICDYSLNTKELLQKYQYLRLSLKFLEQEEIKLKRNLCQEILNRKKSVYSCLMETVQNEMQPCYDVAKAHSGKACADKIKQTIMQHIIRKKTTMFDQAKDVMLKKLEELKNLVEKDLDACMDKVINLSLSHDAELPDISDQFSQIEEFYNNLGLRENQGHLLPATSKDQANTSGYCSLSTIPTDYENVCKELQPEVATWTEEAMFYSQVSSESDQLSYRLRCPSSGAFQCRNTGLVFVVTKVVELQYKIVKWDETQLQSSGRTPAGPLYDIKCPETALSELLLPHCEPETADLSQSLLSVAHISDSGLTLIKPQKITESHVVIPVSGLSLFGLVWPWPFDKPQAVSGQVMFFCTPQEQITNIRMVNMSFLPRNIPVDQVKKNNEWRTTQLITAPSKCELVIDQQYSVVCSSAHIIQPERSLFDMDNEPNFPPTFELWPPESSRVSITVTEKRTTEEREVWRHQLDLTEPTSRDSLSPTPQRNPLDLLRSVRCRFVNSVSDVVLKQLLDRLLHHTVLNYEEMSRIAKEKHQEDKARHLIDTVIRKGSSAASVLIEEFCKLDPCSELSNDLRAQHKP